MPGKDKPRPALRALDELFERNGGINPIDEYQHTPIVNTLTKNKRYITIITLNQLTPFKGHPFRLYDGERLDDMVASVKVNGVLVPIIVRRLGDILEILSGHNRVEASKLAGLVNIPALIYDDLSDDDAMVYVIETNLIQRSFADMAHSEKAAVLAMHHSKMFSQGKRNDIIKQIQMLENPHDNEAGGTCAQVGHKLKSREILADEYNLTRNTVARYLRINQLIPPLKSLIDNGYISFIPAVTVSYLTEPEQILLAECIEHNDLSVDMKKADMLREFSQKNKLSADDIIRILSGEAKHKPNRTPTVKVKKAVYSKYFKPNQSAKEVEAIVEKALHLYFQQQ